MVVDDHNLKGSYNSSYKSRCWAMVVDDHNLKGSYNSSYKSRCWAMVVDDHNLKGSYNTACFQPTRTRGVTDHNLKASASEIKLKINPKMKTLISLLLLCLVSACSSQKLTMHEANIHYADK